jgi:hypothetical protein
MTSVLQLTEQQNPLAQTFRVVEPGGSVLTAVGLFFQSAPSVTDLQLPITVELRPVVEGRPSSTRYIPGTQVSVAASVVRSAASTTFSDSTEVKFTFREPVYIPENIEVALVAYTSAKVGQYKIWAGTIGEHVAGSTTKLVTHQLDAGAFYQSSNGTSWSVDQFTDIAFKVYRAVFQATGNLAHLVVDVPPAKKLTENTFVDKLVNYPTDPLIFTANSNKLRVLHPAHGFIVGDNVTLSTDSSGFNSSSIINGVLGSSILGTRVIDSADPYGYTISMDSVADSSGRAGGIGVFATEQYVLDEISVSIPNTTPPYTDIFIKGDFTTHKSFAGNQTAYARSTNVALENNRVFIFRDPHVIASEAQESDATKLNGSPSTIIKVGLNTLSKYTAPYFNVNAASIVTSSNFIDYQDSDNSTVPNRNKITTIDYVAESQPSGGTSASKHISIPYTIENSATSIRVLVDAMRPSGAEFSVWYRTAQTSGGVLINDVPWTEFSKTINPPNKSNYSQIGNSNNYREYEFNVYDIPSFDQYQIKIVMYTTNSVNIPTFRNLRTIATV